MEFCELRKVSTQCKFVGKRYCMAKANLLFIGSNLESQMLRMFLHYLALNYF